MGASGSKTTKEATLAAAAELARQQNPQPPKTIAEAAAAAAANNNRVTPVSPGSAQRSGSNTISSEGSTGKSRPIIRQNPHANQAGSPASSCGGLPVESLSPGRVITKQPTADELDDELEALASEYMATQASSVVTAAGGKGKANKAGENPSPPLPTGGVAGGLVGRGGEQQQRNTQVEQKLSFAGGAAASAAAQQQAGDNGGGGGGSSNPWKQDNGKQPMNAPSQGPVAWQRGQLLGAGSFGRVFFGLNTVSGELMAVKQINYTPGQPTDATRQAAQALLVEVRCLQALFHPNIVRYLGVERDDVNGVISIMLEYCAGGSIAGLLDKFGPFNEGLTRSYLRMVLSGLHFLHTRPGGGILHRDIKGANVLVDSDGVCKLADFGASKLLQQDLMSSTSEQQRCAQQSNKATQQEKPQPARRAAPQHTPSHSLTSLTHTYRHTGHYAGPRTGWLPK